MNAHWRPNSWLFDTFVNLLTNLGVQGKDKIVTQNYTLHPLDANQLSLAYRGQDSTRAWRNWQADKDDITKIEDVEKKFSVPLKVQQAIKKARLFGGAVVLLGVDIGNPEEPLDYSKVGKDGLKYLHVASKNEVSTGNRITDIRSEWFGQPEYYERNLTTTGSAEEQKQVIGVRIHPSRVIQLLGNEYPDWQTAPDLWADSSLQSVDDAIRSVGTIAGSIAQMITDAKLDIIKVPNLSAQVANAAGESKLTKRFAYANTYKSIINALIMDKEEEWERIQVTFAGMPEVLQMYLLIASGAADIPVTRLLGQSPAGMNATGESDIRNYYDRLNSDQKMRMTPVMTPLDEVLVRSALGTYDETFFYNWNSLWQLDDVQKAALWKSKADTFKIDSDAALIPADILREARVNQLIEDGTYPGLEQTVEDWEAENGDMSEAPDQLLPPPIDPNDPNAPVPGDPNNPAPRAANTNEPTPTPKPKAAVGDARRRRRVTTDARPRGLYVYRKVQNAQDIVNWAREQGFKTMLPKGELHVTVAYCRKPIDWTKIREADGWGSNTTDGTLRIAPGGMRLVDQLGDQGAIVLFFSSSSLCWRHQDIEYSAGAEYDYPDYQPHITITYNGADAPALAEVEAYQGPIVLGPEVFEEIQPQGNYEPDTNEETVL
jgi:phage-related protein (TIGR01555 family)